MKSGTLLGQIAKYSLIIIGLITIVSYIVYRSTKRIKITKKIKKEDKLKYIDQLTSLKNRKTYKKKGVYSYGIGYVASKTGVRVHSAPGMGFGTDEVIPFETKLNCFSSHDKDGFEWWCIDVNRMKWVRKTSLKNRRGIKEFIEL
mgnify:CR=1 FL=1